MRKIIGGIGIVVCGLGLLLSACSNKSNESVTRAAPISSTPPTPTQQPPSPPGITTGPFAGAHVYVVVDTWSPTRYVVSFPGVATGSSSPDVSIVGSQVSVDGAGNIYVLGSGSIEVYSPIANPGMISVVRSLPVGANTKIPQVVDVVASKSGEIFVSEGNGIAVFSSTATGNADPVRFIVPQLPGSANGIATAEIAVDDSDNLYVHDSGDGAILVFGPVANGVSAPDRTITGPQTFVSGAVAYIDGMATDDAGNLYVSCFCRKPDSDENVFDVLEFGPAANGNVAPMRTVTTPGIYANASGGGIAVDSAGTIYWSGGTNSGEQVLYEFSSSASGSVEPTKTVTWSGWTDTLNSRIAVY